MLKKRKFKSIFFFIEVERKCKMYIKEETEVTFVNRNWCVLPGKVLFGCAQLQAINRTNIYKMEQRWLPNIEVFFHSLGSFIENTERQLANHIVLLEATPLINFISELYYVFTH